MFPESGPCSCPASGRKPRPRQSKRALFAPSRERQRGAISPEGLIYLRYVALAALIIGTTATVQIHFIIRHFEWHYAIAPVVLITLLGFLLGRVAVLSERLKKKNAQFRAVTDLAQEFVYFRRLDGQYDYVSPSCRDLTGYSPHEFLAEPNLMGRLIHPDDHERWRHHVHNVNHAGLPENLDLRLIARDGRTVWFSHLCAPVYDESGAQIGVRSTNLDITQRKAFEDHVARMAYYDLLTGLPNRHMLSQELHRLIESARVTEQRFAVLFLDLDRFKQLNDSFGHALGDLLLEQVAQRLQPICVNGAIVGRYGGDEFLVLAPALSQPSAAVAFARQILEAVEQPFSVDGKELYLSGSIGVALYPYDGQDTETLIRNANAATNKTKKDLQGNVRLFSPELAQNAEAFISIEGRLRKALKENELVVHYQPIVEIANGRIIGLEALVRWQHPEKGLVPPAQFIPVAEETGLIKALGEQVLAMVCQQIRKWEGMGISLPVAVNISARQFADPDFCLAVEKIVQEGGCQLSQLALEVTEQSLLADMEGAVERLTRLQRGGMSISLDDFGTGYSSLSYLRQLPIDKVKIDRSFISDVSRDVRAQAILRAIISLCRELNLGVVTEGIETKEQRELLKGMGCHICQGFLFSKPLPVDQLELLLTERRSAAGQ